MKAKEKAALIDSIEKKLAARESRWYTLGGNAMIAAEDIFRVISRISHSQVPGDQRKTKKSRAEIDAQIAANVKSALRVL